MKKKKDISLKQRGIIVAIGVALTALLFGGLLYWDRDINQDLPEQLLSYEDRLAFQRAITSQIEDISPKKSRASQPFKITDIEYTNVDEANVYYNDGHTYYTGRADFFFAIESNKVKYANITGFKIIEEGKKYAKDQVEENKE